MTFSPPPSPTPFNVYLQNEFSSIIKSFDLSHFQAFKNISKGFTFLISLTELPYVFIFTTIYSSSSSQKLFSKTVSTERFNHQLSSCTITFLFLFLPPIPWSLSLFVQFMNLQSTSLHFMPPPFVPHLPTLSQCFPLTPSTQNCPINAYHSPCPWKAPPPIMHPPNVSSPDPNCVDLKYLRSPLQSDRSLNLGRCR